MQYAGVILNDISNAGTGICVSFYTQGCPHKCEGCHNPQTWDFAGGQEFTTEVLDTIVEGIGANGIERNLCILGGEPLCGENEFLTYLVIENVRKVYPNIKIYLWTGYTLKELSEHGTKRVKEILALCDVLIDGPFIQDLRDVTLPMRGSTNQNVYDLHNPQVASQLFENK